MPYTATVARVLIASPGDALSARDRVERAIYEWNASRAHASGVLFMPVRWETAAVPVLSGTDGQEVINSQLVDSADVVIALFATRLGQATARALSGTAEEIARSHSAGKPVHVWFSNEAIPRGANLDHVKAVDDFKKTLAGLYGQYDDLADLANKVRAALEHDLVAVRGSTPPVASTPSGARLRVQARRIGPSATALVVRNSGDRPAEGVQLTAATPKGGFRRIDGPNGSTLVDEADLEWTVMRSAGDSRLRVTMRWTEAGEPREFMQEITV